MVATQRVPVNAMDPHEPLHDVSRSPNRLLRRVHFSWVLAIGGAVCLAVVTTVFLSKPTKVPFASITLECTPQPATACIYQAKLRGYFAEEGINIRINDYSTGRQAMSNMIEKGSDYATCADTPFTRAYSQAAPVTAIAQIGDVSNFAKLLGRRDRGITEHTNSLMGHRIGVTRGTNAEYIVYSTCLLFDVPQDQVTIVDLQPDELETALVNGSVDAVSMWEPFASRTSTLLGSQAVQVKLSDINRSMWLLTANSNKRNPRCEQAILRALIRATADLTSDRERWLEPLAREMRRTSDELRRDLLQSRLGITFDQTVLLELEAQRRWLNLGGPEIFDGLSPHALSEVDRDSVSLIHPEVTR